MPLYESRSRLQDAPTREIVAGAGWYINTLAGVFVARPVRLVATEPLHGIIGTPFKTNNIGGNTLYNRVRADHLQTLPCGIPCMNTKRATSAVKGIH